MLGTINSMMNLKQFGPIVLICVETKWPGVDLQWLYLVVVIIIVGIVNGCGLGIDTRHRN